MPGILRQRARIGDLMIQKDEWGHSSMKVRVLPYQPHCFAFGGFDLQMLDTLRAVRQAGVDAQPMDVWSRDSKFDILHVWGLSEVHAAAAHWAKKSGKRMVMTALLPYLTPITRLKNAASQLLGRNRTLRNLMSLMDVLVVVNKAQARTAEVIYDVPPDKIVVIPNIIADRYFLSDASGIQFDPGIHDYLICTGNISPRKNQLNLAKAALAGKVPLLLVGPVLSGEEAYAEELARLIAGRDSVRWIAGLPVDSQELLAAYQNSVGFALASHLETQPISALEAAAIGKPLLLADRPWAHQGLYRNACLVNPDSLTAIQEGLETLSKDVKRYTPPMRNLEECRSDRVGQAYVQAYKQALQQ